MFLLQESQNTPLIYTQNLMSGSNCFWMIADYEKYNRAMLNLGSHSYFNIPLQRRRYFCLRHFRKFLIRRSKPRLLNPVEDDVPSPGRWYHAGIDRTCSMLKDVLYEVVDPDVGTILRDPIIHFTKP
jgi:hypothetical protein